MVPSLRRGAPAGDAPYESGGSAVPCVQLHFPMRCIGDPYRQGPQRRRTGPRILPSPLLLVSEPEPAWIMPAAGTFMRGRHAATPKCMAPPRSARPQPGGEREKFVLELRELREDACLGRRIGLRLAEAPVQDPQSIPIKARPETQRRASENTPPASGRSSPRVPGRVLHLEDVG